jgi:hypothetical protein
VIVVVVVIVVDERNLSQRSTVPGSEAAWPAVERGSAMFLRKRGATELHVNGISIGAVPAL